MTDTRSHRGPHPDDERLFARDRLPTLRAAVADLSWLRTRRYGDNAALEAVGNRYRLTRRQRDAVARSACSERDLALRRAAECASHACTDEPLLIDGFNTLITLESALGGAFLFVGRDGCYRDIGGLRGTYRLVAETQPAIQLAGTALDALETGPVKWVLDAHVSNTGRLKAALTDAAQANGWGWHVEIDEEVDAALMHTSRIVVTSDSEVLDQTERWLNLTAITLQHMPQTPNVRRIG